MGSVAPCSLALLMCGSPGDVITHHVFRPGAGAAIASWKGTATYVVTNSGTAAVRAKLTSLASSVVGAAAAETAAVGSAGKAEAVSDDTDIGWLIDRVHGSAKKYAVDSSLDQVRQNLSPKEPRRSACSACFVCVGFVCLFCLRKKSRFGDHDV